MAVKFSDNALLQMLKGDGTLSLSSDTIKAMLLNGTSGGTKGGTLGVTNASNVITATATGGLAVGMKINPGTYAITFTGSVAGYIGAITTNVSFTVVDAAGAALNVTSATNAAAGLIFSPGPRNVNVSEIVGLELSGTGYTGGYGGGGRVTVGSKTFTKDDANQRAYWGSAAPTWSGLAAALTVTHIAFVKEVGGSDATALYIAAFDWALTTNGATLSAPNGSPGISTITG